MEQTKALSPAHPLLAFWSHLVEAPDSITNLEQRRRSKLLSTMLIVVLAIGGTILSILLIQNPSIIFYADIMGGVIGVVFGIVLLIFNRRGNTNLAAMGFIGLMTIMFTFVPFGNADPTFVAYAIAPVIVTGIFFSFRYVVMLTIPMLITIGILNALQTDGDSTITFIWYALIFLSALILVFINHLNRIEQIRRQELEKANAQLRESEAILEQRVHERTAELRAAKLETEQALQRALEADELKSQFLASMSHELRTPLNSILSFSDLMSMGVFGDVTDEQVEYLGKIQFSGRHLLSLINDVLDISKIESGMMKLFIEEGFDPVEEVQQVRDTIEKMIADKPVAMELNIEEGLPLLTVDKRRIRQVLLNLLSNASKFTESGTITISVTNRQADVLFAIVDTGPGIPADKHHEIFQPFVQSETGIKHAGGTGLGLPISRRLVEAHGGKLWLESTVGEGSAFYFNLPVEVVVEMGETNLEIAHQV